MVFLHDAIGRKYMKLDYPMTEDGMFILTNEDFETIATELLEQYVPKILKEPQALDIDYFAQECLPLDIRATHLTLRNSILGMMIFAQMPVDCYDEHYQPQTLICEEGTMLVESSLLGEVSRPRLRFTKAHEVGHWIAHRTYHSADKQKYEYRSTYIACRGASIEQTSYKSKTRTTEDWMELQADKLAAALLMPRDPFIEVALSAMRKAGLSTKCLIEEEHKAQNWEAIEYISNKFEVSKTATQIRMKQIGLYRKREEYSDLFWEKMGEKGW